MGRYPAQAVERALKIQEVILRAVAGEILRSRAKVRIEEVTRARTGVPGRPAVTDLRLEVELIFLVPNSGPGHQINIGPLDKLIRHYLQLLQDLPGNCLASLDLLPILQYHFKFEEFP
jgi:hypothetical protein